MEFSRRHSARQEVPRQTNSMLPKVINIYYGSVPRPRTHSMARQSLGQGSIVADLIIGLLNPVASNSCQHSRAWVGVRSGDSPHSSDACAKLLNTCCSRCAISKDLRDVSRRPSASRSAVSFGSRGRAALGEMCSRPKIQCAANVPRLRSRL